MRDAAIGFAIALVLAALVLAHGKADRALTPGEFYDAIRSCSLYGMNAEVTKFTSSGKPLEVSCRKPEAPTEAPRVIQ
jgi:hypothetical protein